MLRVGTGFEALVICFYHPIRPGSQFLRVVLVTTVVLLRKTPWQDGGNEVSAILLNQYRAAKLPDIDRNPDRTQLEPLLVEKSSQSDCIARTLK